MSKGKIKIYLLKNGKFKKKNKIQSLASKDGVFYKRKGRGGGIMAPTLSRLVVMRRGCFSGS